MEQKTLQDLLKMSLKLSDQELQEWPNQQISEERQEWLKEAMDNVLKNEDIHVMKACLQVLTKSKADELDEKSLEEKSQALEGIQLLLFVDHNATDLHLIGGLKVVTEYLSSPYSSLRWRAAEIIADATQNKPICQLAFTDTGGLVRLIEIMNSDDLDIVKVKAIYAMSCVTKNCSTAMKLFLSSGGITALLAAIKNKYEKLKVKAAFMLINLIVEEESIVADLVSSNIVQIIISHLRSKHNSSHEHLTHLLLEVIIRNKQALLQCRMAENGLKKLLSVRRDKLRADDVERFQEETNYCDEIFQLCFPASTE